MRILFDPKLRRPGCVLLQAVAKCDWGKIGRMFPSGTWLTHPTPDMAVYDATDEQIPLLVAMAVTAERAEREGKVQDASR